MTDANPEHSNLTKLGEGGTQPKKELETFPNRNPGATMWWNLNTSEFTCICPKTGQPDFAEINIRYVPDQKIVESKSLKLYLWTFRDQGTFHEHFANRLLDDLVGALDPRWCRVEVNFNARGGIGIIVTAEHGSPRDCLLMRKQNTIQVGDLQVSNDLPFTLFGGMNVLENRELALEVASTYKEVTDKLGIPYVFKASFDKANRSSISSFRGPGLEKGCEILAEIKETYQVPVISDIHEPFQAKPAAEVIDVLQLPAFLCRQTDLVVALAETGRPVNVKKAQFLAAHEMGHIIDKFKEAGNEQVLLCERGSSFGYNNLVVDPLNFGIMKRTGCPVVFDVTHSLQIPGGRSDSADGRRQMVFDLMLAGMSQGIGGLFLESHLIQA